MRDYLSHEVRNVAVMGHSGSGQNRRFGSYAVFYKSK